MTTRTVVAGDLIYRVADDITTFYSALVWLRVMDEPGGAALRVPFFAQAALPGAQTKTTPDGMACVCGDPAQVLPKLAAQPYAFTLTLTASGYNPATLPVNIPMGAALPLALADVALTPQPVNLVGRVISNADAPIANAKIFSAMPSAPFALALRTPLRFDHVNGVTVRGRALNPAMPAKSLSAFARSGSITLSLNNRAGLAAGHILQLGDDRTGELVVIDSLPVASPNDVTLTAPTQHTFAKNTAAQVFSPGVIGGTPRALSAPARAGEGVLMLNGDLSEEVIEISDGPRTEYAFTGALTDADGRYRITGITHVKSLRLQASAGAFQTSPVIEHPMAYTLATNELNFRLKP